jgi:hypothetical protein
MSSQHNAKMGKLLLIIAPIGVAVSIGTQILMIIIHFSMKASHLTNSFTAQLIRPVFDDIGRQDQAMCGQLHHDPVHYGKPLSSMTGNTVTNLSGRSTEKLALRLKLKPVNVSSECMGLAALADRVLGCDDSWNRGTWAVFVWLVMVILVAVSQTKTLQV